MSVSVSAEEFGASAEVDDAVDVGVKTVDVDAVADGGISKVTGDGVGEDVTKAVVVVIGGEKVFVDEAVVENVGKVDLHVEEDPEEGEATVD